MEPTLDPNALYVIHDFDVTRYARTPDGVGCYWYDENQREEARGDVCDPTYIKYFQSFTEWEEYRYREV
jgi:hypothetical protein